MHTQAQRPPGVNVITLFYDDQCAFCRNVKAWLDGLPKHVPIRTVPYASPAARQIFPDIERYQPDREILALTDAGGLYLGGDAWIICLWATRTHRKWAKRLSSPTLRPMAKKIAAAVASHRYDLSKFLYGQKDGFIVTQVNRLYKPAPAAPPPAPKVAIPSPTPAADPEPEPEPVIACACDLDPHELTEEELVPLREQLNRARDLAEP